MLTTREELINCEQCHCRQVFVMRVRLDAVAEPQDKEDLLAGKVHTFVCAKCKCARMYDFPLFYADRKKRLFVLVENSRGAMNPKTLWGRGKTTQLRIVSTRNQLIEKILIRDAKLDDRVVEFLKIQARFASLQRSIPVDGSLMFSGVVKDDEGEDVVQFQDVTGSNDDMFLSFPLSYYRRIAKQLKPFIERMPMPKNRWLRVDNDYGKQLDRLVEEEDVKAPRNKRSRRKRNG